MKRLLIVIVGFCMVLLVVTTFIGSGLFSKVWPHLLMVQAPLEKADALILLGGDEEGRPVETARLFKAGVAPKIFITGEGDASANRKRLLESGIPSSAIIVESSARTTLMNAQNLQPLLESAHVRSAVIVTSPFHMRRALAVFRHEIPGITFGISQDSPQFWKTVKGHRTVDVNAFRECLKIGYYWISYGISPFL